MNCYVFSALFVFAVIYDLVVGWAEDKGYIEGVVSLFVVFGVGMTLIGVAFLDFDAALLSFYAFVASGIPMIFGSLRRYVVARRKEQEGLGGYGDKAEGMAE